VTCDPTNVSHARELVVRVDIEHVFKGQGGAEKIASGRVNNTFWFAGGSGRLRSRESKIKYKYLLRELT